MDEVETAQPHDSFFRSIFSEPEAARALLRAILPAPISAHVDWPSLAPLQGSFVDEELVSREVDLLFAARIGGRDARLYLLLEHQSTADPRMPFRLLRYLVRIWEREPTDAKLPVIVPVVVHNGPRPWSAPRQLHDCLDADEALLDALGPLVPRLTFALDDLVTWDEDELRRRTEDATATLATLLLRAVRAERDPDAAFEAILGCADLIRRVAEEPATLSKVNLVLRYILGTVELTPEQLEQLATRLGPKEARTMRSTADRLREEGLASGLERGLEQGLEQGRLRGKASLVLRQIELRFGLLAPEERARLDAADEPTLDRWSEQLLFAGSKEEIFG